MSEEEKKHWYMVNYAGEGNIGWISISRSAIGNFTSKNMKELTDFCCNYSKASVVITGLVYLGYMADEEFNDD